MTVELDLAKVRLVANTVFDHLEKLGHQRLEIGKDFYWSIPANARYDPYVQPSELTLGQLTDDWSELDKIITGKSEPMGYALVWLAAILRTIGESSVG